MSRTDLTPCCCARCAPCLLSASVVKAAQKRVQSYYKFALLQKHRQTFLSEKRHFRCFSPKMPLPLLRLDALPMNQRLVRCACLCLSVEIIALYFSFPEAFLVLAEITIAFYPFSEVGVSPLYLLAFLRPLHSRAVLYANLLRSKALCA